MILSTTKKENTLHFQQKTVLDDVLDQKRKEFESTFLSYPDKEKVAFLEKNKIVVLSDSLNIALAILAALSCILLSASILTSRYSLSLSITLSILGSLCGLGCRNVAENHFIKSKLCSPWLTGKKSKQLMKKSF